LDDIDAPPANRGRIGERMGEDAGRRPVLPVPELPYLDLFASRKDSDDLRLRSDLRTAARFADVAGIKRIAAWREAGRRLREGARQSPLAQARRADEKIGSGQAVRLQRLAQRAHRRVLPEQRG